MGKYQDGGLLLCLPHNLIPCFALIERNELTMLEFAVWKTDLEAGRFLERILRPSPVLLDYEECISKVIK